MARGERRMKNLQDKLELHNERELVNYEQHAKLDNKDTCTSDVTKEATKISQDFEKTDDNSCKTTHKMNGDCTANTAGGMTEESAQKKKRQKKKIHLESNLHKEVADEHEITKPKVFHGHFVELKPPSRLAPIKRPLPLAPIQEADTTVDDIGTKSEPEVTKPEVRVVKNSDNGCHGPITTWWIRRKESRRNKKREAIEARKSKPAESLVASDKRAAKEGVSFTVDLDTEIQPAGQQVLPPIRQRNGPIRMASEKELKNAENNRKKHINNKKHIVERKDSIRVNSRLVLRTADRRAQLQQERQEQQNQYRCTSKMESSRKTSPLPKTADNKSVMHEDHDDDIDIVYGANSKVMSHSTKNADCKSKASFHPKNAHCKSIWDEDFDDDLDIIIATCSSIADLSSQKADDKSICNENHDDDLDIVYGTN